MCCHEVTFVLTKNLTEIENFFFPRLNPYKLASAQQTENDDDAIVCVHEDERTSPKYHFILFFSRGGGIM